MRRRSICLSGRKNVKVRSDFCPYIFTHEEIRRLFEVVDHLPYWGRYPKYHLIYPMLLRILYGCGLRLNEALLLKTGDVDTTLGVLYLSNTKNGSQRCVPMSVSLWKYVDYYLEQMSQPYGKLSIRLRQETFRIILTTQTSHLNKRRCTLKIQ